MHRPGYEDISDGDERTGGKESGESIGVGCAGAWGRWRIAVWVGSVVVSDATRIPVLGRAVGSQSSGDPATYASRGTRPTMESALATGVAGLPTEVLLVLGALAVVLAVIAIRIAIAIAIRVAVVALAVLGGLWLLAEFADVHVWLFWTGAALL